MNGIASRAGILLICATASVLAPQAAFSADCTQANAIYADRDGAYELKFVPLNSDAAAASNQFKMSALKTSVVMDGYVMPSEDPVRADGILMFHCPEGDATGADLDACTIWQGQLYGINAQGETDNLPAEGAAAAQKIMLPGLGPAIRQSSVWGTGKATLAPWDVLTFKGCAK